VTTTMIKGKKIASKRPIGNINQFATFLHPAVYK
jgi:hypothetical protein